ncbi:hypothetical protein A8F95_05515 [Bacillus wudalianchiensis]|uniref:Peptidase M30 n=2 Tax=Pseudobacillus wudalianchiensis TaxID=1743143 RepID=A0A1B9AYS4_9BACI|nr:hypothetical protein A8F95_05515 [Bacillus wudalianchiensis]
MDGSTYKKLEKDGRDLFEENFFEHNMPKGMKGYYYVTAIDENGNESEKSEMVSATANIDAEGNVYVGNSILISNESLDWETFQSIGTWPAASNIRSLVKKEDSASYDMDKVISLPEMSGKQPEGIVRSKSRIAGEDYQLYDEKEFFSQDENEPNQKITATLLYNGKYAQVWADDSRFTEEHAKKIGEEFDNRIYPLVTEHFGSESDIDGNGKISLLCFDIQGDYAGFFSFIDLIPNGLLPGTETSNSGEVLYIDTDPLMEKNGQLTDIERSFPSIVHELQHLVNANRDLYIEENYDEEYNDSFMDIWLNEGLSVAAEHVYNGPQLDWIEYYNRSESIPAGHSLLNWEYDGDVRSNYSLSYLFLQYLRIQSGQGTAIYKELINDEDGNYKAVEKMIHKYIDPDMSFGEFMTAFRAALVLKAPEVLYGFKGEEGFDLLSVREDSKGTISLRGGGAILKPIDSEITEPADKGKDVKYNGIFR